MSKIINIKRSIMLSWQLWPRHNYAISSPNCFEFLRAFLHCLYITHALLMHSSITRFSLKLKNPIWPPFLGSFWPIKSEKNKISQIPKPNLQIFTQGRYKL